MRTLQLFREFLARVRRRMKPERVQNDILPSFDVPMTNERLEVRQNTLSTNWSVVNAPVAIRYWRSFDTFKEAAEFISNHITAIVEHFGFTPIVQIEGNDVAITLGIDQPHILSEGDFDFATAIDEMFTEPPPDGNPEGDGPLNDGPSTDDQTTTTTGA